MHNKADQEIIIGVQIAAIIQRFLLNQISEEDLTRLESWLAESSAHRQAFKQAVQINRLEADAAELRKIDMKLALTKAKLNIRFNRQPKLTLHHNWLKVAALLLLIATISLYFFRVQMIRDLPKQEVGPGKTVATLTLANGRKIRLNELIDKTLKLESGIKISKNKFGELVYDLTEVSEDAAAGTNTIETANAERFQVRLPDGSAVWLNSASSITYPLNLKSLPSRRIILRGEAYFEVSKDPKHPFLVQTAAQEIEVLGTKFNVNSYIDEAAVATTLLEGSVLLRSASASKLLRPGEQALNRKGIFQIVTANLDAVMDWKSDEFYLNRVNFKTAMRKIARWYDVEIIYDSDVADDIEAGGWVSRHNQLSTVLKLMEKTGLAHFRLEGKKVYVSR